MKSVSQGWLDNLKTAWLAKDIASVLTLFSDDVLYFETPFQLFEQKEKIEQAWQVINEHDIQELDFTLVHQSETHMTVRWIYRYKQYGRPHRWGGLYVISLNKDNLCDYFYQVGERDQN